MKVERARGERVLRSVGWLPEAVEDRDLLLWWGFSARGYW
jgi:hypothetical protein